VSEKVSLLTAASLSVALALEPPAPPEPAFAAELPALLDSRVLLDDFCVVLSSLEVSVSCVSESSSEHAAKPQSKSAATQGRARMRARTK
jgi:hypothetical protein